MDVCCLNQISYLSPLKRFFQFGLRLGPLGKDSLDDLLNSLHLGIEINPA